MYRSALPTRGPRRAVASRRWRPSPWAASTVLASTVLAASAVLAGPALAAGAATARLSALGPVSGSAVAGWGQNDRGELGTGQASNSNVALPVLASLPPGTQITQVAPGCSHS